MRTTSSLTIAACVAALIGTAAVAQPGRSLRLVGFATSGAAHAAIEPSNASIAQLRVISLYERGDFSSAAEELHQLATGGDIWAMRQLASLYAGGRGVSQDSGQALRWLRTAATAGDAEAALALGAVYARGAGVTADEGEARQWLSLAVRNGDDEIRRDARRVLRAL